VRLALWGVCGQMGCDWVAVVWACGDADSEGDGVRCAVVDLRDSRLGLLGKVSNVLPGFWTSNRF